ncbi:MAG: hypothetical protein AAF439_12505, partial [Pseudomonadota bacterium]
MATIWEETFETDGLGTRYTLLDGSGISVPEFHTATSTLNDDFLGRYDGFTGLLAGTAYSSSVGYSGAGGLDYFAANDADEG